MKQSSKLIFFGTEQFSVPTLQALIDANYTIVAIVTKPDARRGRGQKLIIHPIKQLGLAHSIPVLQPQKVGDIEAELRALQPDAGILISYGKIIPKRILDVFNTIGIINIHPSALPRYRGPSPIEAAIIAGDSTTAISIMRLDEGMDTGPIFTQTTIPLRGTETKIELSDLLARRGAQVLLDVLPDILARTRTPYPQATTGISVTSLIAKSDGVLDPSTNSAIDIERHIRAYQGYPKPHLRVFDQNIIALSATVVHQPSANTLDIQCADGAYCRIHQLIAPSGRRMSGDAFVRGYSRHVEHNTPQT